MATLTKVGGRPAVVAHTPAERQLLAEHGREGRMLLDEAYYPISGDALVLPAGASESAARRVLGLFEAAAQRDAAARERRAGFRVLS